MKQIDFESWVELEAYTHKLEANRLEHANQTIGHVSYLLFRGQGDASWSLNTTLQRASDREWALADYYRLAALAKTQIETFTERRWDEIDFPKMREWFSNYDNLRTGLPAYDYLVFLRHHGFPSPLLDWSRSLYIAAFFAYKKLSSERVAIYVYQEYTGRGKLSSSNTPQIHALGPNVRSHPRHFLQQSEYTVAARFIEGSWQLVKFDSFFEVSDDTQDKLLKLTAPASDRIDVLKQLDTYNLNEFSLFQTEEALLSTIAIRELLLKKTS